MLRGGGMLYITILSLLAPLASAGVKGFGIIFSVEPMKGSTGGGTELHIAGAGFAYVTQVLVGGKPCHILEQMTKDGELTAFTPALPQGKHDVEVVFTSGHRAKLRDGQFQSHSRYTPVVNTISQAASVISNVTWRGDLKKMLEVGMNEIFRDTGEKRNATEIMHAYLGTGIEILSDKAGRDEFRCDILETPTETEGVCEVSAGTPAGYYNFTYVLQDGVSMNGYGKSVWEVQGLPYVSMDGQEYAIEVYPTIHSLRTKQVGRMGGAPVYVEADGIFVGKADFAARHQVTLDGVPCVVEEIENLGNTQVLQCTPGATGSRPANWPKRLAVGSWASAWEAAERMGPFPGNFFEGMVERKLKRAFKITDYMQFQQAGQICSGSRYRLRYTSSLEECAENCFFIGCRYFDFRRESRECRWCIDVSADGSMSTYDPGWTWHPQTIGGVYKLNMWMDKYLKEYASEGPNWKLLYGDGRTRCAGDRTYSQNQVMAYRMGGFIQQCADWCSSIDASTNGGNCTYFGILAHYDSGRSSRCVIYTPNSGLQQPEQRLTGGAGCVPEEDTWVGHYWTVFELTRETPLAPPPSGIHPGGRGVLVRVWNLCPKGNAYNDECNYARRNMKAALHASLNPEYRAQKPMLEVVRNDVLRGAFGFEHTRYSNPVDLVAYQHEGAYKNMHEATGNHGIVEEMLAFFVAPVTGYYSFLTWGDQEQDVWLSQSNDPADLVKVATQFYYQQCRSSTSRRRNVYAGCSIFNNYRKQDSRYWDTNLEAHQGTNFTRTPFFSGEDLGYRTPTEQTMYLTKGERRFFVKRAALAEDWRPGGLESRRRRRARQFTGLRIQRPDLSDKTDEQKALLSSRKGWPEILVFKKIIEKTDGQWRVGLREHRLDEPTWSDWITWNFNEWSLTEALNLMVMPSGTKVATEGWWMDSYSNPSNSLETVTEYMIHMWRPGGNLPPVLIEYDLMRSRVEVAVVSNGNGNDLFLWPLSASLFEVPALESSVQVTVTGVTAAHSTRTTMETNVSNFTNDTEVMSEIPFPCVQGQFSATSCSESLGCEFSSAISGLSSSNILDSTQLYDTLEECQQRCCQDEDCFGVSYDSATKYCTKHKEFQDHQLDSSSSGVYSSVVSRRPSTDGYAAFRGRFVFEGIPLGVYAGHRSVTFCKERCAAEPLCNSFSYHETWGCHLRSQCVTSDTLRGNIWEDNDDRWVYYKTMPLPARCAAVHDWSEADRTRAFFPSDPFGSSTSTIAQAYPGRRRSRWTRYNLGSLLRTSYSMVSTQDSTRRLSDLFDEDDETSSFRRLDSVCEQNCTDFCNNTGDVSDDASVDEVSCLDDCLVKNCGIYPVATNTSTTRTLTSTTTTTLPPPPVRLVQLSGDIFNVGDALPQEGTVAGRVEVFYNGEWGTVCKDNFGDVEASVVCGELGLTSTFARADTSAASGSPGSESQPILLDDVSCTGTESHLSLCDSSGWGVHNCFHSEDIKVVCDSTSSTRTTQTHTSFTVTTSTTTTTSFQTVLVTPRTGLLRQDLTGRCVSPVSCEEEAALQAEDCKLYLPDRNNPQKWMVNMLGQMESTGCAGMCISPTGDSMSWDDRNLVLKPCEGNMTSGTMEQVQQRFYFHADGAPGLVQSQFSGKCMDTEGSNGRDSIAIMYRECEHETLCYKKGMKWEPLNMDGQSRTSVSKIEQCMQRCASVQGCAHFSWWTNGGCHLQDSNAMMIFDNNAYSGPPTCTEVVTDQRFAFVAMDLSMAPTRGLLRNAETKKCLNPQDLDNSILELSDCDTQSIDSDQRFDLLTTGQLQNINSGLCVNVTEPQDGTDPVVFMTPCGGTEPSFELDNSSRLVVGGRCVNSTGSSNGDSIVTVMCTSEQNTTKMTLSWEFVESTSVSTRCAELCMLPTGIWDIWVLHSAALDTCECGHFFREDGRWNLLQEGLHGNAEMNGVSRFGLLRQPQVDLVRLDYPVSITSSIAAAFMASTAEVNESMGLGVFSMKTSLPMEIPESGDEPETAFGFSYLSEAETPYVDSISVNGVTDWVNYTVEMTEGDTVILHVRNFDGLMDEDVKVRIGLVVVPSVTVTESSVSFTAPLTTFGPIVMQVMAGWKGWADFAPFLELPYPQQQDNLMMQFDTLNELFTVTPSVGSMVGGAQVTITGRGFQLPGLSNVVELYHYGGDLIGQMAGACNVSSGSLTSISCQMPTFSLSHWSSTQFEERMEVRVNGQRYVDGTSTPLLFKYSRPHTPIVLQTIPESLSFALTNNITVVGYNFGLLKREAEVMIGNRTCKIWDVTQTHINCQLKRSAMAFPPLCTENKDIYNEDCVVKPHNFFQKPNLLVTSRGYSVSENSSYLDTRFEIHSVEPPVGSEEGGARVTVRGVGFGNKQLTPQLTIAALGTLGDVETWSDTEVVFITRKLTLNVAKVDLMVNLISAKHKCGSGPDPHPGTTTTTTMGQNITLLVAPVVKKVTSEDCEHRAFRAYVTPNVTAVSSLVGNLGDIITFTVSMPAGYIANVGNGSVSVLLGTHACPHSVDSKTGNTLQISCAVPAFEASTVPIKVRILPLGYARMGEGLEKFTQSLTVEAITPNSGSKGGMKVMLTGKGFSTNAKRHFVRVGSDFWDVCEPLESSYESLTCFLNYKDVNQGSVSGGYQDVEVMLWDTEVSLDPLSAFGNSQTGCLRGENDWRHYNVFSQEECALRCLTTSGCKSFDYSARYQRCFMSDTSFTSKSDAQDQRQKHCRYYERRSEEDPSVAVSVTVWNFFTYSDSNTPSIDLIYALPATPSPLLQGTAVGCSSGAADLTSGNSGCCTTEFPCGVNEGECSSDSRCAGDLQCVSYSCSWTSTDTNMDDSCCVLQGQNYAFVTQEPLWTPEDRIYVRVSSLGDAATAVTSDPSGGAVNITFAGVPCPIDSVRSFSGQSWIDLGCSLGPVPGGLAAFPMVQNDKGAALDQSTWIFTRLNISTAEPVQDSILASASSLGGGWKLNVTGTGFAPPKSQGAETFVEVMVCGRPCEVVEGTPDSLECIVPNVTTPEVLTATAEAAIVLPAARVLTRNAGTVSDAPLCFHGVGENHYEVGHSTCAAVFDDDPEVVGGTSGTNCHVGVDFGKFTNARVEKIRWHPLYDFLEASSYINSKFQIGTLIEPQTCDELSYGWRGVEYTGCQDVSERGNPCMSWQDKNYDEPSLAGHSYCRNPLPGSRTRGIWCWLQKGGWEYCNPKVPEITWTDVYTVAETPKMLWNDVVLTTPVLGRFVRFLSASGNCQIQEMQVVGQLVAPAETCEVAVRNVQYMTGPNLHMNLRRLAWRGGIHYYEEFPQAMSEWVSSSEATITFAVNKTPTVTHISPMNGTARGGTSVTIYGTNFGPTWMADPMEENATTPVTVDFNGYSCEVQQVTASSVICVTVPRSDGIKPPSMTVTVEGAGNAWIKPGTRYRYLDRWSLLDTWANQEPPIEDALVSIPQGQAILLDEDTPVLLILTVEGVLVFDNKDIHLQATYIWVKGGTMEIGTEQKPFLHRALITLHGQKYSTIRLPVIGGKVLAVSNTQFTIRELGDNAVEEGNIGTLDIHGRPRIKVWTRLAETANKHDTVIVLQDVVDWQPGEELMIAATDIPHKHFDGNGLHGAPPVDFHNERVFVQSVASDMKTITLTAPLKYTHISTYFTRPLDNEYIDLSAEVALLSRNVKIQGEAYHSERDQWGGHTMVAFGGIYRLENAEFFRLGQTGEVSRYPIHFHITQDYGKDCYARYNSIHHSFQRAVAIHSTNYVNVKGNVAFDIIGHMFFIETGMEMHNTLEGNLGVGAIPLLSGMLESDQEPAGFWTAAPNNVWRDNVAVTGSDGWYFQLPGTPISHNIDIYKDSICPVGTRIGEWRRNRCHHLPGSCIRIYLTWIPRKEPCNADSAEDPQILFNTTCWGIGKACYNAMKMGSVHNHHMTAVEGGKQDYESIKFIRSAPASHGNKFETDFVNIPHIKDSVFVRILPQNLATKSSGMSMSVQLPQNEQFYVTDSMWINTGETPVFKGCAKCWTFVKWRQGAHTYRLSGLSFTNVTRKLDVHKKDIFWDLDGSLTGTPDSYTSWADAFNLGHPDCVYTQVLFNTSEDGTEMETTWYSDTGMYTDSPGMFKTSANKYQHEVRNHTFMTCTTPIRKLGIAWPEPQEVHLRQLIVTNLDTGLWQAHEFEKLELFGWGFPVVANQRLEVRPNFLGMDLTEGGIQYGFNDLLASKEGDALKNKKTPTPEWLQLQLKFWMNYNHVKLTNPYSWWAGTRYGESAELRAVQLEEKKPYLTDPTPLDTPESLPSMTHGMKDARTWAMSFRYPKPADAPAWESVPYGAHFEARKCPDEGCILNLPDRNQNWTHYILWSEKFGDVTGQAVEIDAPDWIMFDMDLVVLKNLTIKGKLSFDDSQNRILRTGNILVWGVLEIGTASSPFGQSTGNTARVELTGNVLDLADYMYIQEQSLWGKVVTVIGQVNTYGAPIPSTWLRLASSISATDESACVLSSMDVNWTAGSTVAFSVNEFDTQWASTVTRTLNSDAVYDASGDCWRFTWSGNLGETRFAADVPVGNGNTVSLRAAVAKVDRSVVFASHTIDTTGGSAYGGHIEIIDLTLDDIDATKWVGTADFRYTHFETLGKGALSAAVKVTYSSNFEPPPVISFHGCSWTNSQEYALHLESANVPTLITENVMFRSYNGGIFLQTGSAVHIKDNVILGVALADTAPRAIAEDDSQVIVMQYAGIRADELPVRMIGNLVAGSNDMGYMHPAERCPPRGIFNNEAHGTVTGVYLFTQKGGACQTINLYTIWKAAHVALYLSDVMPSQTQLNNIVVADSHIGIIPYMSVGSAFRRLYLRNTIFIGTSPAGTDCSRSVQCRTQTLTDPYMLTCSSMYTGSNFRRVGFVTPIQTVNKKSCWATKPGYQCRLMSPAQPSINPCHQPWEKDIHMQKGLGWTFFEDTTFAYYKSSDCGMTDRAIAPNMWGAEVNFPATFTRTTWYETDLDARFELSTEILDDSYGGRASPCKSTGGGCMGLDQLLFQDMDGTLTGLDASPMATVLPLTPRTDIVWAPFCETMQDGVSLGAQVCANTTVDLLEMINLDRGAKDIKFGPLVLTPDVPEDNGFQGGVLSSVGPFYASCPCGWDFSFYHVLIKPDTTYYAEVMSLPENFRLRYWSPRPDDKILLEIFYPDSRGVNVFVGGAKDPDMALKLGEKPTMNDPHGSHVVDAQALRLYVVLHGSEEGFSARKDLVIRRTPTVKLKMNIEITIEEFNADQFQTNLAILLGIPPERIVVAAVAARRRLSLMDTSEESDEDVALDWDEMTGMPCSSLEGCMTGQTPRRRLVVNSQTALDISISPSTDAAAAASGGDSTSQGADALNAQTNELTEVSSNIAALSTSPELAAAVGAEVTVSDIQEPATVDEAANEQVPSANEVTEVQVVDITAVATTSGNAEVSAEAPCLTAFGVTVTVASTVSIVYLTADLANGATTTSLCSDVDSGYDGNIALSCNAGTLKADASSCSPLSCTTGTSVTVDVGGTTASVSPTADLASGIVSTQACGDVNADYTGNYDLYCNLGVLTYDVTTCSPGCGTGTSITLTVAGSTASWNPSSTMTSGQSETTDCEPINSGYTGTLSISCFFGVLSANPSACSAKPCAAGSSISVTLDGVTNTLTTGSEIKSGFTGLAGCADVNSAWGNDLTLRCTMGALSADISTCAKACSTSDSVDLVLGNSSTAISPNSAIASGSAEYLRSCSEINSGFSGTYTLSCNTGTLSGDLLLCAESGCTSTQSVSVTVGDTTTSVAAGEDLAHGSFTTQLCENVNPTYTGTLTISCAYGAVSLSSSSCEITPCEPWHFVAATLEGTSGLLYPRAQIASGASGVGECGNVNVEYSGDFEMSCVNGALEAGSSAACRLTCSTASVTTVTLDGFTYDVSPANRIPHLGTGVQACGNVRYGYGGEVQLACNDGTLSVTSEACLPEPCPVGLLIDTTIYGIRGVGELVVNASHLGIGQVACSSINPETVGMFEALCIAKSLSLVSETVCQRSCTADSMVDLQLDGYTYSVSPVGMIVHNTTATQNCSDFSSGYTGTIDLKCMDNVTTVVSHACVPNPCLDPRTNEETTVEPYTEYTELCSTINSLLLGDITYSCIGGQIRTNTSACNAPCNETSDPTLHGSTVYVTCPSFLGSQYDGNVSMTCADGTYLADSSACVRACLVGETDTVVVNGNSHTDATVTARLSSGNTETGLQCSTLDAAYSGTYDLTCTNGLLSDSHSCHEMCLTTDSVTALVRGSSYNVMPVSDIVHGTTGNVPCSSHLTGYAGDIVLTCTEGSMQADGSGCQAPCTSGSSLSVTFGGASHTVTLTSQITSGTTGTESCNSVDNGFNGDLVLSCSDGAASMASNTCTERPCAQDLGYALSLGGETATNNLASQVTHAATVTVGCGTVASGWGGDITVTCIKGSAIPDYSACLSPCVLGTTTSLVLGVDSESFSVSSTAVIAHGATGTESCAIAHQGFEGNIVLSCDAGTLSMDSNTCVEKPCLQNLSYSVTLGQFSKTLQLDSQLSHGGTTASTACSVVDPSYDRDFTATCNKADMVGNMGGCLQACTTETVGLFALGPETGKVSPSSRLPGDGSSFGMDCSALGVQHQGTLEATCSAGALSINSSCIVGCGAGLNGQVVLEWLTWNFPFEADMLDGEVNTQACPSGFSSTMTIKCNGGYAELQSHTCVPLPCPTGTVSGEFDGSYNISETTADYAHNQSFTEQCAWANPGYTGSFQATCKFGNITGDYSTCIGNPCPAGTNMDVTVGWVTANQQHPTQAEVVHGTTWNVLCSSINGEFSGNVEMRCSGTNFRADTSQCTQIEVGCLPTGLGQEITVVNETATLLPSAGVTSGAAFARDCGDLTNGNYVGTVSATCGTLGSYTGIEISCVPRSCVSGIEVTVAKGALSGLVTTSAAMSHLSVETTSCEAADQAMRGELRLVCQFGNIVPDTSSCQLVCLPSRPGQVILGNKVITISTPEEVADTRGFFTECNSLYTGFSGTAQITCNGGALVGDVTNCAGLPCETGNVASVTLYDVTQSVAITQDLLHGASESAQCNVVNPDYSGSYKLNCFADVVTADVSTCVCQAQGCSDAPCGNAQTFFVELSGIQETRAVGQQLSSLESATLTCASVVPGHDGDMTVTCNGGVLVPDVSQCTPQGCTASTPAVEAVVGGASLEVTAPKDLQHNEVFMAEYCANVSSGYAGEIKVTCFLGALVVDGASCTALPCQDELRDISVGGFSMTVRLAGDNLGSVSPAPSGFQATGTCSQLDANLLGSFTVGCTASVYSLDLSGCILKSCDPPITATAGLGTNTQSGALRLGEQYEHDCQSTTSPSQNCTIGCALGWGGIDESFLCWQGDLIGTLPNCSKLPVYASVRGALNLAVDNPEEFVNDPNAKKGITKSIADMCQVNESEVNVTLEVVNTSEVTAPVLPDRRLVESQGSFLERLARRLQELVVKVDYVVNTEVADQSEAVTKGLELVQALSLPTDDEFAQSIVQAIVESGGATSYAVTVTDRQAELQVVIGDEVFSPEELEFNMSNYTTTLPFVEVPQFWDPTPLIWTMVIISILGLCVGAIFGRWYVRRKAAGQQRVIFGAGPDAPDVEVPEYGSTEYTIEESQMRGEDYPSEPSGSVPSDHGMASQDVPQEWRQQAKDELVISSI